MAGSCARIKKGRHGECLCAARNIVYPGVALFFFQHLEFSGQLAGIVAQKNIAPLRQSAGIDHNGAAHAVYGPCLVNVPAQADVRLGFFKKFAYSGGAHMHVAGMTSQAVSLGGLCDTSTLCG